MRALIRICFALVLTALLASEAVLAMSSKDKSISSDEAADTGSKIRTGATGMVRTQDGVPVVGAVVSARSLDQPARPIPEIAILTNEAGIYFWSLRPGRYELTPLLDDRRGMPATVTVRRGEAVTLDLILPR